MVSEREKIFMGAVRYIIRQEFLPYLDKTLALIPRYCKILIDVF